MSELFVSPEKVSESMTFAMASCQAIKVIDSKTIGDPLDLKMFEFTKWALEEGIGGSESAVSCIVRSNRQVIDVAKLLSELEKDSPGILEARRHCITSLFSYFVRLLRNLESLEALTSLPN